MPKRLILGILVGVFSLFIFGNVKAAPFASLENDALMPLDRMRAAEQGKLSLPRENFLAAPYGAGFYDTSEYMMGKISIAVILPQCDGVVDSCSESWDAVREASVYSLAQSGMNWWAGQDSKANISFVWHLYSGRTDSRAQTSYEPISRPSEDDTGFAIWIPEIMGKFGFESGDYFERTRAFINSMVAADGSNWGYVIYVADSLNDADGAFVDGRYAGGYYGGPFMFATYNNNGYGPANMDYIVAHETGHVFYATDEYDSTPQQSGYLGAYEVEGSGCLMQQLIWCLSSGTQEQVGWRDSNSDGIMEILDTAPSVSLNIIINTPKTSFVYTGSTNVNPLANQNPLYTTGSSKKNDISLNTISEVSYQLDDASWKLALAKDASFSTGEEDFEFNLANLSEGKHTIKVKAKNNLGIWTATSDYGEETFRVLKPRILTFSKSGPIKVFNAKGKKLRQFYPYGKNYNKEIKITTGDLNGDNEDEIITITQAGEVQQIKIFNWRGKKVFKKIFYPFGKKSVYKNCNANLAAGDVDSNGKDEIAVSLDCFGQVNFFNKSDKKVYSFYPFSKNLGSNLAIGDFNNDNKDEVAVSKLTKAEAQVSIYRLKKKKFKLKRQFFAYDKSKEIEINLASADINNNGKAEIIVAPKLGYSGPIKAFNYKGKKLKKKDFYAFGNNFFGGINMTALDLNHNDFDEILLAKQKGENKIKIYSWQKKKAKLKRSFWPDAKNSWAEINLAGGYFRK